ncbi:PspC domain-containing protein [Arcticibacter sp.]|uniref:PspC domain-containing protein n=1 Tax=Arcticibacter sp. TaxID=1872630 RepID=UPI00388E048C
MDKKLQRDESNKILAGVAAGLAEYFDIDVIWVRLIFLLMVIMGFSGVLVYLILWIVVPAKPYIATFNTDYRVDEQAPVEMTGSMPRKKRNSKSMPVLGAFFVALGLYFLFEEFGYVPDWFDISKLWPVILIVLGLVFLLKPGRRSKVKSKVHESSDQSSGQPLV